MRVAVGGKNKLCFVDGTLSKPTAPLSEVRSWERCNLMVMSGLYNGLIGDLADSVIYAKTARDLLLDLENRFLKEKDQGSMKLNVRLQYCNNNYCQLLHIFLLLNYCGMNWAHIPKYPTALVVISNNYKNINKQKESINFSWG